MTEPQHAMDMDDAKESCQPGGFVKIGRLMQDGRGMTDRGGLGRKRRKAVTCAAGSIDNNQDNGCQYMVLSHI